MGKYPLPYTEAEIERVKLPDGGQKLGGHSLHSVMAAGWYQIQNRKERNSEMTAAMQEAKRNPEFKKLLDAARKKVKTA